MSYTLSQKMANRLNALRSTGPKTAEGKARSSRNARSHGLSRAVGAVPPLEWADLIESRKSSWRTSYQPKDDAQDYLFDRLVVESIRLDQCEARIAAARIEYADRAAESWDDDRRAEVAELGSKLASHPDRIQPLLLQSKHGVEWLLDRWQEVVESLRYHDYWTAPNWQRAMDLLGLSVQARGSSTPHDLDLDDITPGPGLLFVEQIVELLRARLASFLNDRDARARLDAELGLELSDPKPIRLLERYAAAARRRVRWAMTELRTLQSSSPSTADAPTPSSARPPLTSAPEPRPERHKPKSLNSLLFPESPSRDEPDPAELPVLDEPIHAHDSPARNEPIALDSSVRNESLATATPSHNDPDPDDPPARNEPDSAGSSPSQRPRTPLQPTIPVLLNRRGRRAQAAAARRRPS